MKYQKSITQNQDLIVCPACDHEFEIADIIRKQVEAQAEERLAQQAKRFRLQLDQRNQEIEKEKLELKQLQARQWEIIQERLKNEKIRLTKDLESKVGEKIRLLQQELATQNEQIDVLKDREEVLKKKENEFKEAALRAQEKARKELQSLQELREKEIRKNFEEQKSFLRMEYEKKLGDQEKMLFMMQEKIKQGNMKVQGMVQEAAILDYLQATFVSDRIAGEKSGKRGADCLHVVMSASQKVCGKIYYESKRTKTFQRSWTEKLKADMTRQKADIGVIVTRTMPSDMDRMGMKDGIWICSFKEFKGLSLVLRESIVRFYEISSALEDKDDKIHLLYTYLTGNEFRRKIEAIVDGFSKMQEELQKEKRAMQSIWARREKQIEKVLLNTSTMYHSIKGIAGNAVSSIPALEMPEANPSDE